MDPDQALEDIRKGIKAVEDLALMKEGQFTIEQVVLVDNVLGAVQNLDDWLSRGGFLPKAWQNAKTT